MKKQRQQTLKRTKEINTRTKNFKEEIFKGEKNV
jgi:hypothetical protein